MWDLKIHNTFHMGSVYILNSSENCECALYSHEGKTKTNKYQQSALFFFKKYSKLKPDRSKHKYVPKQSHLPHLFETDLQVKTSQLTNSKTPAFRRARPSWPPPLGSYSRFSDEHPGPILIVAGDFPNSAKNGKKGRFRGHPEGYCLLSSASTSQ